MFAGNRTAGRSTPAARKVVARTVTLALLPLCALALVVTGCVPLTPTDPSGTGTGGSNPTPITPPPTPPSASATRQVDKQLSARGVNLVRIQCGAGSLQIIGTPNSREITVKADIFSKAGNLDEAMRLRDEIAVQIHNNDPARPTIAITDPEIRGGGQSFEVDLRVWLPPTVALLVEDKNGNLDIRGLQAGANITHGMGSVTIENVNGGVDLTNQGGPTKLTQLSGKLDVRDGRGDLTIEHITGNVDVKGGGGVLAVRHVSGNVRAANARQSVDILNIDGKLALIGIKPASAKIEAVTGGIEFPVGE